MARNLMTRPSTDWCYVEKTNKSYCKRCGDLCRTCNRFNKTNVVVQVIPNVCEICSNNIDPDDYSSHCGHSYHWECLEPSGFLDIEKNYHIGGGAMVSYFEQYGIEYETYEDAVAQRNPKKEESGGCSIM